MEIISHKVASATIAEIVADTIVISNIEDGTELLGNIYYQGFDAVILYEKNISPDFFDLKTKIAGEILQKFTNYRIRLIIIGDFSKYNSKSLNDFIFESNKGKQVKFLENIEKVLQI